MRFPRLTATSTAGHVRTVLNGGHHRFRDELASALGWWAGAGLDMFIDEDRRDWLAAPPRPAAPSPEAHGIQPPVASQIAPSLPDTLEALVALLATGDYAPGAAPPGRRVAPSGPPGASLMIVADMPDPQDSGTGQLFAGETSRLFDAMLAAIGRTRDTVYLAPFSPARVAGRIAPAQGEALARLMRRHIALAAPQAVMLFGDEPARWLIGPEALERRGGLRVLNHDGGTVSAIATFHPRHLHRMPALKASAWADMRLLPGVSVP